MINEKIKYSNEEESNVQNTKIFARRDFFYYLFAFSPALNLSKAIYFLCETTSKYSFLLHFESTASIKKEARFCVHKHDQSTPRELWNNQFPLREITLQKARGALGAR